MHVRMSRSKHEGGRLEEGLNALFVAGGLACLVDLLKLLDQTVAAAL